MGLDMYLTARTYVKNWDFHKPEERHEITILKGGKPRKDINISKICSIVEDVGYWRKANQIHQWFVENVQGGEDECREHYVSREKLKELHDLCLDLLSRKDSKRAEQLLPTQSGFFFGSTDVDEWYWQDIEYTVEILKPLLSEENSKDYYYRSSW